MQNNEEKNPVVNEDLTQMAIPVISADESESENVDVLISEDEIEGLSKTQLIDKLTEYLALDEVHSIFPAAVIIKKKLDELAKEEYDRKLQIFTEDGSLAEDFEPKADLLDEKAEQIWKSLNAKKVLQRKQKEKSAQENLSTKKLIIEELKELLKGNENFSASYHKFQALQTKWRVTGNVPIKDTHTLRENYFFLTGKFYDMVKINNELNVLDKKKNIEHKIQLCEKAEQLNSEPSLKKSMEALTLLQEEWSEIRNSSRELKDNLWLRFKAAGDKIIERKKEHSLQIQTQQKSNLAAKTALCEQIELLSQTEFVSHKGCREATEKENAIWEAWQKISFVPKSDNGKCWTRFKTARLNLHQSLDQFYAKQRSEFSGNLEKKIALCLKAEALQESSEWVATAEVLKKLQVEWKTIGQVATKDSDAVWMRFRKACDHFFESKTNQVAAKENTLKVNIQAKEALITKTDQFLPSEDIHQSIEELKKLQEEWALAGETPLKDSDRLNNAFGKAIENLLERMKVKSNVDDKMFYRLKYEQMLKSPQGMEQIRKERSVIQDKIKKLQTEVDQLENNLSFFGKSKSTNPLILEYQENVEKTKLEVKELSAKLKLIPKP